MLLLLYYFIVIIQRHLKYNESIRNLQAYHLNLKAQRKIWFPFVLHIQINLKKGFVAFVCCNFHVLPFTFSFFSVYIYNLKTNICRFICFMEFESMFAIDMRRTSFDMITVCHNNSNHVHFRVLQINYLSEKIEIVNFHPINKMNHLKKITDVSVWYSFDVHIFW